MRRSRRSAEVTARLPGGGGTLITSTPTPSGSPPSSFDSHPDCCRSVTMTTWPSRVPMISLARASAVRKRVPPWRSASSCAMARRDRRSIRGRLDHDRRGVAEPDQRQRVRCRRGADGRASPRRARDPSGPAPTCSSTYRRRSPSAAPNPARRRRRSTAARTTAPAAAARRRAARAATARAAGAADAAAPARASTG